ncbi:MAG: hypothetical protein ACRCXX_09230 [Cetobacterium sp.]|uniref:hypothetical protein n=1 Tax=Cetobacterium sp. TaxID=2071632 RepID=UPI003F2DB412
MKKLIVIGLTVLSLKSFGVLPVYDVANHQANEAQRIESIRQTLEQIQQSQGQMQQLANEAKHLAKLNLNNTITGLSGNATGLSNTRIIQLASGTLFSAGVTGASGSINIGPKFDSLFKIQYNSGMSEKELNQEKSKLENEARESSKTALEISSRTFARVEETEKFNNYIMQNIDSSGGLEAQQLSNQISAKNMVAIADTNVLLSEIVKTGVINQQNEIQRQKIEDRKKEINNKTNIRNSKSIKL